MAEGNCARCIWADPCTLHMAFISPGPLDALELGRSNGLHFLHLKSLAKRVQPFDARHIA
jgi:hypothetical protein